MSYKLKSTLYFLAFVTSSIFYMSFDTAAGTHEGKEIAKSSVEILEQSATLTRLLE
ncbi:hypothetical protein U1E44_06765 [Arenibacter sp. GZD96]|uniref:hypothetical protein n=1 Tax=Aurantibrevibacter litoralis TaxID=3106030 RepID=UPI002AFFEEA7|nr:hypothetical protein [Arenibacter sp. GZD-96]MEA1785786.1 hypothetical protein [Arenibacter sp. GZD-96]